MSKDEVHTTQKIYERFESDKKNYKTVWHDIGSYGRQRVKREWYGR